MYIRSLYMSQSCINHYTVFSNIPFSSGITLCCMDVGKRKVNPLLDANLHTYKNHKINNLEYLKHAVHRTFHSTKIEVHLIIYL